MIIFSEAQTLSYSTQFNYLGNALNYNNTSTISIKGKFISDRVSDGGAVFIGIAYVDDGGAWVPMGGTESIPSAGAPEYVGHLSYGDGGAYVTIVGDDVELLEDVGGDYSPLYDIWAEMDAIKYKFQDFQDIYLNGVLIGSGRVTRITFPESVDPRTSTYEAEIEMYKEGNMDSLAGISLDASFCKYLTSLDEDFTFTTDKDGVISYKRSLDFVSINPNDDDSTFLTNVKEFAESVIYNDPSFEASVGQYPGFYSSTGSKYYTESYNVITGSFNFTETFQGPTAGENFRWSNSLSASLESEGLSSISEKGTITGVSHDILDNAYAGMAEVEASSLSRANTFYGVYNQTEGECLSGLSLISKTKTINREAGTIEYSFEYSNDPLSTECFQIARTIDYSKNESGIATVSEKGSVKSVCAPKAEKLTSAITYFEENIKEDIEGRIFDCYEANASGCGCSGVPLESDLRKVETEHSYGEFAGVFEYSYTYKSDCMALIDDCYYVSTDIDNSDTIHNVYLAVTPYDGEIAQKQNTSSLATQSQSIVVTSICPEKIIDDYLATAISFVAAPVEETFFMNSAQYTFDPNNSKFTLNINYSFAKYRAFTNHNV